MKKILSLVLIIVLVLSMLVACGGPKEEKAAEVAPQEEKAAEMDVIYYAYNSEPILTWDPSIMFSNGIIVLNNVYETLLKYDSKTDEYINVLATGYSVSDDGLSWTFDLREGVKFHDGTDFNAQAVKFSVERTVEMEQGASYIWHALESVNVISDYQVEFKLMYESAMDLVVSAPYAAFIMSPSVADQGDDWFEAGNEAGTGPYMLESASMGDEVILTQYADYWNGWDGEHFEKAIIKKTPETSSRRQMIESGEADVTMELPSDDVIALQSNDKVEVIVENSYTNLMAFFNTANEDLSDPLVRKALSYAVPYADIVDYAAGGFATQSTGPIPAGMWGHSDDLMQYNQDLDKAKSLLDEAGIKEGDLKLLLTYMSGDEAEKKSVELYKAALSEIGVELEIRGMNWDSQWEMSMDPDPEARQDIFVMYWWPDINSPYSWLYSLFHTEEDILFNLGYYSSEVADGLMDDGDYMSGSDKAAASESFIKAQEQIIEDNPAIYLYDKQVAWIKAPSLGGFKTDPIYPYVVSFYDCYRIK